MESRKRLPVRPSIEHMRKQAKRSAKLHHLDLVDAQHRVAPEYGSKNRA